MDIAVLRDVLQNPELYGEPITSVEVRETHISLVFLTDRHVYKVKKPVDLGFLDFSSLDRRRLYCDEELTLNRRLSTGVYLEVLALHETNEGYTFARSGRIVEYVLKMRRLPDDCSLEAMLHRGVVTAEMLDTIARRIVAFHQDQPLPLGSDHLGTLESVTTDWDENFTQTREDVGKTITPERYNTIREVVGRFLETHADWFKQRVQEGRIRDCHGDLRAEHIYIEPEHLHIIDCIEFNKRFRFIDVASDIAFLAVDLERLGAPALAHHFVHAYVRCSGDFALYRLVDFYRCYRAYVRGKVTSIRLRDMSVSDARARLEQRAELYFTLAETYARRFSRPLILCTTGLVASGKSTVAEGIAAALDLQWIRSDIVRKELTGVAPQTSQCTAYGAGIYTQEVTQKTYAALADRARQALAQGHSVVLDASFSKHAERQRIADLARDLGVDCCVLECVAPEAVLRDRLRQREDAVASISDAREDILKPFRDAYEPVQPHEVTCHVRVDTTQPLDVCVPQALADIWKRRSMPQSVSSTVSY